MAKRYTLKKQADKARAQGLHDRAEDLLRWAVDRHDPQKRFWRLVDRRSDEECWEWRGAQGGNGWKEGRGYGYFKWRGRMQTAHRVAYEIAVGPIPDGLHIDHLCRNHPCVNPRHLEPVTRQENLRRSPLPGMRGRRQSHCKRGHARTEDNVRVSRNGMRHCRECERMRIRASRQAKRQAEIQ